MIWNSNTPQIIVHNHEDKQQFTAVSSYQNVSITVDGYNDLIGLALFDAFYDMMVLLHKGKKPHVIIKKS